MLRILAVIVHVMFRTPTRRLVLLVGLTLVSAIGVIVEMKPAPTPIDVPAGGLANVWTGSYVRVACDRLGAVWEEVEGDHVVKQIALCKLGSSLIPVVLHRDDALPHGTTIVGRIVEGKLRPIRDRELWVRDGLRKDRSIDARSILAFIDATEATDREIMRNLFMLLAGGSVVLWLGWFAVRWRRKAPEDRSFPHARVVRADDVLAPRQRSTTLTPPAELKGKIQYATMSCEITRAGIDARREDGAPVLVLWPDVGGLVVRRLPSQLGGSVFVDVVSTSGSTLRILPWTKLTGESPQDGRDPARALARLLSDRCPAANLDPATQAFVDGSQLQPELADATG